jgi:pimeloyl-ACP methyl ester carboxylesterase
VSGRTALTAAVVRHARRTRRSRRRTVAITPRLSAFLALGLPTAYVTATEDRTIEPDIATRFARRLPGADVREVPGGHDCTFTRHRR